MPENDKYQPMTAEHAAEYDRMYRAGRVEPRHGTDAGRDPARIDRILSNLRAVWTSDPGRSLNSLINTALSTEAHFATAGDEIIDEWLARQAACGGVTPANSEPVDRA